MAKRIIKDLTVAEVSIVDRGAGQGCRVLLRKRLDQEANMTDTMSAIEKAATALRVVDPTLSAAAAFTKIFEALPFEQREVIKAAQRADGVPRVHAEQAHDDEDAADDDDNETRNRKKPKALRKLLKIAKRIRAESPSLTEAQSIAKVLSTPAGAELYRRDRMARIGA